MLTKTAKAIAENKPAEALNVVDDLIGRGQDLRNFCRDLLSFFRDLLIFKMAGDAEHLLDTAVLSHDELIENSAPFSESDLIRFFNSLSETESKLREATQPRYVLEIGLVKLIEMRRLVPIEKILERLAKLENNFTNGNPPDETSAQQGLSVKPAEKKTLNIDFPLNEVPFPISNGSFGEVQHENLPKMAQETVELVTFPEESIAESTSTISAQQTESTKQQISTAAFIVKAAKIIEAMPLKLPPISSEELEHIEDNWLDDEYERKLTQLGDDLSPIKNAPQIIELLFGENQQDSFTAKIETSNGSAAFAPAKVKSNFVIPTFEDENESTEIPVLPEIPTEEDLWHYAQSHPMVKKALRMLRGKIVEVTQKTSDQRKMNSDE
jgi:DNA polymerase III gamma/tau subunit